MKKHSIKRRKTGGRRKSPKYKRSVSIKSAEKILRSYYRKKNKGNVKKATRALRRDMATKSLRGRVLRSKGPRSYHYRHRPYSSNPSGPADYDMHGLDNKHTKYKNKRSYRKLRKYSRKRRSKSKRSPFVTNFRNALNLT
tara:strand:+ start:98 stop:517 length:420 start_codon:yes stop_codon:yes gene_type:complete